MLTYKEVTYHEDPNVGIVYFYTESRMAFCKECPMEGGKGAEVVVDGEKAKLYSLIGCPCDTMRSIPSASISCDALKAIKEAGAFDELIEEIKNNDMPIGSEGKLIV